VSAPSIKAIPTRFQGVNFRSRLEAKFASFLQRLAWRFEYEPDLQAGLVIPDFLLTGFAHAIIVECKPEITPEGLARERRALIHRLSGWLRDDVLRELRELDVDPDLPLELTDRSLDDLVRIDCGANPRGRTRRVLVVGPTLHGAPGGPITLDGDHGFCVCTHPVADPHVGLALELGESCLACGADATAWVPEHVLLAAWKEAGNSTPRSTP